MDRLGTIPAIRTGIRNELRGELRSMTTSTMCSVAYRAGIKDQRAPNAGWAIRPVIAGGELLPRSGPPALSRRPFFAPGTPSKEHSRIANKLAFGGFINRRQNRLTVRLDYLATLTGE